MDRTSSTVRGIVTASGRPLPVKSNEVIDGSGERIAYGSGGTKKWLRKDGSTLIFNTQGRLIQHDRSNGHKYTYDYDSFGRLSSVNHSSGRSLVFIYEEGPASAESHIIAVKFGDDVLLSYEYDESGNLTQVYYADGSSRRYHYEDTAFPSHMTGVTDQNSIRVATYAYDEYGRVILSEHAGGAGRVELEYQTDGSTDVTDALDKVSTYTFTDDGYYRKLMSIETGGSSQSWTYPTPASDFRRRITQHIDPNGFETDYSYFRYYNYGVPGWVTRTRRIEAAGTSMERMIDSHHVDTTGLVIREEIGGKATSYSYNSRRQLVTRIEKDIVTDVERTTTYTYCESIDIPAGCPWVGLIKSIDGPRLDVSDITTYGYDTQGNRISITNALSQVTQITAHDAAGRPLTSVDPNGLTTTLNYDLRGRLTQQSLNDGSTTRTTLYGYDPVGNLTRVTQPDGSFISYDYDPAHRLIGLEDNQGNRIDYTLDAMGNRLSEQVSDPNGTLTRNQQWVYDELGQVQQLIDSQNNNTAYSYDANGNLTQTTDAKLNPTAQTYDALDRLKQQTDALDGTTQYTYDAQDNLTSVTDPSGLTTTYNYDGLGNLISQTSPDTGTTTYTYDEAGNRLTQTDARGITVNYSYDALNRLTHISYPDTSLNVTYTYDQGTYGIGKLTGMSDTNGTTTYTYNAYGDLITQTRTSSDSVVTTFSYDYDTYGRLASLTYPSGNSVNYTYDAHGQLNSLTYEWSDGTTQSLISNLQTLPFGPVKAFDYGNGLSLTRSFDQDYQLVSQTIPGILQSSYQHDPVGNITDWQDLLSTGQDQLFDYDALYRLTSANGAYGDITYTYDATGNRLSLTLDGSTETYSYVPSSHRLQQILGSVTDSRSYDAAGNTIQSLIGSYTYDDTNRMVGFTKTSSAATYAYNGKGERISKNVDGTITRFRYGPAGQLLGEYDQNGQAIREYITLEGQPVALVSTDPVTAANTIYYLHTDHLGAVVKA
ncbi:MAG: hypothetical protein ACH255_20460, partial [Candidatus Thiodiazotropha sp.]